MNNFLKKSSLSVLVVIGIGICINQVTAREIRGYDITIPRFGNITTGRATKEGYTNGVHNNSAIGGNKRINTSIQHANTGNDITPSYSMGSGDRIELAYYNGADAYVGNATTLSVATPVTTYVKVQAQGSWSPDAQ